MNKIIAVIGDSHIDYGNAKKVFRANGFNDYVIEMHNDYKKLKRLNYEKYKYNDNYVGILCGPIPHSVNQKYYSTSIMNEMENCEGYPPIVRLIANNTYKITNGSLKRGIEELKKVI